MSPPTFNTPPRTPAAPLTRTAVVWYWQTADITEQTLTEYASWLSTEEQEQCQRLRLAHDRRDYAAAHVLLRMMLTHYGGLPPAAWTFQRSVDGKPRLLRPPPEAAAWEFNLSHTRGLVACGLIDAGEIGVDVEQLGRIAGAREISRVLTSAETAWLAESATHADERLLDLWTLKEAYLKGTGRGLAQPLNSFSITYDADDRIWLHAPQDEDQWLLALAEPTSTSRLAVAVRTRSAPPRVSIRSVGGDVLHPRRWSPALVVS